MWKLAAIMRLAMHCFNSIGFCTFLLFTFCSLELYFARTLTPQLTSVPLGELQVLPLDAAGEEEVGLLLLGNVLYGHGGG